MAWIAIFLMKCAEYPDILMVSANAIDTFLLAFRALNKNIDRLLKNWNFLQI